MDRTVRTARAARRMRRGRGGRGRGSPRGRGRGDPRGRGRGGPRGRGRGQWDRARKKITAAHHIKGGPHEKSLHRQSERTVERDISNRRMFLILGIVAATVAVGVGIFLGVYFGSSGDDSSTYVATTGKPYIIITTTEGPTPPPPETTPSPFVDEEWNKVRGECGRPKQKPTLERIVGGDPAVKHSWPWQIGLIKYKQYSKTRSSAVPTCGGALVGPRFIISATHCFLNSKRTAVTVKTDGYRILIGGHVKGKEVDGGKFYELDKIIHHPKNNLATFGRLRQSPMHDISVLKLKKVIDPNVPSPVTSFVCLPKPKVVPAPGRKCWATGWGKVHGTGYANVLKQVLSPIASEFKCRKKYGSSRIKTEAHLCGGPYKGNEGTCQGDSGGPLVCQEEDGTWVLYGATSFGPQPCGTGPSVWAQLSYYMEWVCCHLEGYGPCSKVRCRMQ